MSTVVESVGDVRSSDESPRPVRVLLVPDSTYWITGTIAKSIAAANPSLEATIISGPILSRIFGDAESLAARFDLVHFICPYASREWLPLLRAQLPVVTSHHHVTSWDIVKHNLEGDAIVAGSEEWVRDLRGRGADMSRVFCVPYGVDVDLFAPPIAGAKQRVRKRVGLDDGIAVIGFFAKRASNDDDRKGTDVFAEAVRVLHRRLPDAAVLIVGPGWHDLVERFRSEGIRCSWIPFVESSTELPPLYHALDFYWVTSRVEGGPVPLLEAMSSEVCCLTTPVGLAQEVVRDGRNGLLLPMNDAGAFARGTAELWSDGDRRAAMARAARKTMIEEMQSDDMARRFLPVYRRAIDVFSARNPGRVVAEVPEASPVSGARQVFAGVPWTALSSAERRKTEMLEMLAWSENLVLYQSQYAAALRLIFKAWRENPASLEPPRVLLRRFLPERLTRMIVRLKNMTLARA